MTADARLAGELATAAGELLVRLRADSELSGKELGAAGDEQANDLLVSRVREDVRTTRCCRRRAPTTAGASRPTACGSSTRSTARGSSACPTVRTGRSTWPCGTAGPVSRRRRRGPAGSRCHLHHRRVVGRARRRSAARPVVVGATGGRQRLTSPAARRERRLRRRRRGRPPGFRRGEDHGRGPRRGRRLRPLRRSVRVGLGRADRRRAEAAACGAVASTDRHWSTTTTTSISPTSWSVAWT